MLLAAPQSATYRRTPTAHKFASRLCNEEHQRAQGRESVSRLLPSRVRTESLRTALCPSTQPHPRVVHRSARKKLPSASRPLLAICRTPPALAHPLGANASRFRVLRASPANARRSFEYLPCHSPRSVLPKIRAARA